MAKTTKLDPIIEKHKKKCNTFTKIDQVIYLKKLSLIENKRTIFALNKQLE